MSKEEYRPLPDYLTIGKSKIEGLGLFATKNLKANHINNVRPSHIVLKDGLVIRQNGGGYINHSNTPNCELVLKKWTNKDTNIYSEFWYIKTIKEISEKEELTLDYSKTFCGSYLGEIKNLK